MSVEINVGDVLHCEDTACHIIKYTAYTEPEIVLHPTKPTRRCISEDTILFVKYSGAASFETGYLIAVEDGTVFIINLPELYMDKTASINTSMLWKPLSPNKWTKFAGDDNRKIPKSLDDVMYGHTAFPKYNRLIKKYVPLRRRVYLWACTMWRSFTG